MDNLSNMPDNIRTALSNVAPVKGDTSLHELPLCGKINLRGDSDNQDFCQAVETITGLALPTVANTTTSNDTFQLFWLGPDEWLIHLQLDQVGLCLSAFRNTFGTLHAAVTEISDYFSVIQLSGPHAREVIRSGSPFDVRASHFNTGQCAQTHFGHASILLWPSDTDSFRLQIRWSYAQYLYHYLSESIQNAEQLANFKP